MKKLTSHKDGYGSYLVSVGQTATVYKVGTDGELWYVTDPSDVGIAFAVRAYKRECMAWIRQHG